MKSELNETVVLNFIKLYDKIYNNIIEFKFHKNYYDSYHYL